MNIDLLR